MSDRLVKDVIMNFFGLILGQHLLMFIFALLLVGLGLYLIRGGWIAKVIGLLIFAGSTGWAFSILLQKDTAPKMNLPFTLSWIALIVGAIVIWQRRNAGAQRILPSKPTTELNRGSVFAGILVVVVVLTAVPMISTTANFGDYFSFDDRAAERAADRTQNKVLRNVNALLRGIDEMLAK